MTKGHLSWWVGLLILGSLTLILADEPPTNGMGLTFLENLALGQNTTEACKAGEWGVRVV